MKHESVSKGMNGCGLVQERQLPEEREEEEEEGEEGGRGGRRRRAG